MVTKPRRTIKVVAARTCGNVAAQDQISHEYIYTAFTRQGRLSTSRVSTRLRAGNDPVMTPKSMGYVISELGQSPSPEALKYIDYKSITGPSLVRRVVVKFKPSDRSAFADSTVYTDTDTVFTCQSCMLRAKGPVKPPC
jgi:hypothetical protein